MIIELLAVNEYGMRTFTLHYSGWLVEGLRDIHNEEYYSRFHRFLKFHVQMTIFELMFFNYIREKEVSKKKNLVGREKRDLPNVISSTENHAGFGIAGDTNVG